MEYDILISEAWDWLMAHYNLDWAIEQLPIHFQFVKSTDATRPRCNIRHYGYEDIQSVRIRIIKDRDYWLTYNRKTVGLHAPCMQTDNRTAILFQLIHELSHLIEFKHGRGLGEVAPTINEMRYAYDQHYELFTNCQPTTDRRPNERTGKFKCVITAH